MNAVRLGLVVPTLNAGETWPAFLSGLERQSVQPCRRLVIDSGSQDDTLLLAKTAGFEMVSIDQSEFSHGGTRQLGVDLLADCEVVIFATQDILFSEPQAIERLVAAFMQPVVGASYGRQLPCSDATLSERNARTFNYPAEGQVKSLADRGRLGLKTAFISNSFAAYRREALNAVGGFPARLILAEDMYAGAKMLLAGWQIAYCADARIMHSHNQNLWDSARRSFDIGVFHGSQPWLLQTFKSPEREGARLVLSAVKLCWKQQPTHILRPIVENFLKFAAYRLGRLHHFFPLWFNRFFSLNRGYWGVG